MFFHQKKNETNINHLTFSYFFFFRMVSSKVLLDSSLAPLPTFTRIKAMAKEVAQRVELWCK